MTALNRGLIGVSLAALLGACAPEGTTAAPIDEPTAATPGFPIHPDPMAFSKLFSSHAADYEVMKAPADLRAHSDLVLSGEIIGLTDGRRLLVDDNEDLTEATIVVQVKPDDIISGSLPEGYDGSIYVELMTGHQSVEDYAEVYPRNAQVALYLERSRPGDPTLEDASAGRPDGQPIWQPVSPQGFIIAADAGSVVVLEQTFFSEPLSQFLPPSERFPDKD